MYNLLLDRQLGGFNRHANYRWPSPEVLTEPFLERFETSPHSCINLNSYTVNDGLPISCQFGRSAQTSYLCATTDEDGLVQIFDTRPKSLEGGRPRTSYWQAHDNAAFDFSWIDDDRKCLTTSGDQSVTLWDVENKAQLNKFRGHCCSVRSVAPRPGSWEQCASGARDGHIMLWDSRVNKRDKEGGNGPVKSIKYAHSLCSRQNMRRHRRNNRAAGPKGVLDTQQSVTCVLYQHENLLISSGAMDGCVKFWDTRKWYSNGLTTLPTPVQAFEYPGPPHKLKGVVTMCMDPWNSRLFVSYTDHRVFQYDITGTPKKPIEYLYAGHRNDTFYVRCVCSPDGRYLLSGSGRNTGVIWEVDQPLKQPTFLIGHVHDVSAVDWCPNDICKLATLSDDMSLRIWQPHNREPGTEDPNILGYAFAAAPGKQCTRQARVHIVQDEFPWRHLQSSPAQLTPGGTPGSVNQASGSGQQNRSPLPERLRPTGRNIVFRSLNLTPRRSPGLLGASGSSPLSGSSGFSPASLGLSPASSPTSSSPQCASTSSGHVTSSNHVTPVKNRPGETTPSKRKPGGSSSVDSDSENAVQRRSSPRRAAQLFPNSYDSSTSSPGTARLGISPLALPFANYKTQTSSNKHQSGAVRNLFSPESASSTADRPCLRSLDTNSPTKLDQRGFTSPRKRDPPGSSSFASPLSSPGKSPRRNLTASFHSPRKGVSDDVISPLKSPSEYTLSPRRSPRKRVQMSRFYFSSPTANLPNSVFDPPSKPEPTPPKEEKKIDWLTSYRKSKQETSPAPSDSGKLSKMSPRIHRKLTYNADGSATSVSPAVNKDDKSEGGDTPTHVGRSRSGSNSTPKRNSSTPKRNVCTPKRRGGTPKRKISADEGREEETTPSKRSRTDGPALRSSGKKSGSRLAAATSLDTTPNRPHSDSQSPKTPGSMSIRRYLQHKSPAKQT